MSLIQTFRTWLPIIPIPRIFTIPTTFAAVPAPPFKGEAVPKDLAGRSGNSTVLHRPGVSLVESTKLKRH